MKKILSIFILFSISIVFFSFTSPENSQITIVFKARTFKTDTLGVKTGPYIYQEKTLYYSFEGSIDENLIEKKNLKKNDTLRISTKKDIYLYHLYNVTGYSLYKFKPGDTVIFDYPNDYPICKLLNNRLSEIDLNFQTQYNLSTFDKLKTDSQFFIEKRRFRNQAEKVVYFDELKKNEKLKLKKLDSLIIKKSINTETFQLLNCDLNYNKAQSISLLDSINLSMNSGREIVLKSFELAFEPVILKNKSLKVSKIDSRIQFDKVLKCNNILKSNKDYLLYKYLIDIIQNFSNNDIKIFYDKYKLNINDKELISKINKKYFLDNKNFDFETNIVSLLNTNKEKLILKNLLKSRYNDKIVYVDFWASWCLPCRMAMRNSKKLHLDYENKNIVFVYISIDNNFEDWESASKIENLPKNDNFIALNYPNSSFFKSIQLKMIPRYIIYNKSGEIVHNNAPSPDSKEIKVELGKFLSQ